MSTSNNLQIFLTIIGFGVFVFSLFAFFSYTESAHASTFTNTSLATTDRLNVRTAAGLSNPVITTLASPPVTGMVLSEPMRVGLYYWVRARFMVAGSPIEGYVATDFARSLNGLSFPTSLTPGFTAPATTPNPTTTTFPPQSIPSGTTVIVGQQEQVWSAPGTNSTLVQQLPGSLSAGRIVGSPTVADGSTWYEVSFPTITVSGTQGDTLQGWLPATALQPITVSQPAPAPSASTTYTVPSSTLSIPQVSPAPSLSEGETVVIKMAAVDVRSGSLGILVPMGSKYHEVEMYGPDPLNYEREIERVFRTPLEDLEESDFFLEVTRVGDRHECTSSVLVRRIEQRDLAPDELQDPFGVWDFPKFDCTPRAGTDTIARIDNEEYADIHNWERRDSQLLNDYESFVNSGTTGEGGP